MTGIELKTDARKRIAENAPGIFLVVLIYLICITVISELRYRLPGTAAALERYYERVSQGELPSLDVLFTNFRPSGAALSVVLMLISPVLDVGFISYCLKVSRGQSVEYKDVLNGFLFFGKILLISILTFVFTMLWSLLFLFPGIAAHYRYRQAYYILLDDPGKGVLQCISESKRLMENSKLDLFLLDISFLGWIIIDFLVVWLLPVPFSLPIIQIWLLPYRGVARAGYYEKLIGTLVV